MFKPLASASCWQPSTLHLNAASGLLLRRTVACRKLAAAWDLSVTAWPRAVSCRVVGCNSECVAEYHASLERLKRGCPARISTKLAKKQLQKQLTAMFMLLTHLDDGSRLLHQCHSIRATGHQHRKPLEHIKHVNAVCWAIVRQRQTHKFSFLFLILGTHCQS